MFSTSKYSVDSKCYHQKIMQKFHKQVMCFALQLFRSITSFVGVKPALSFALTALGQQIALHAINCDQKYREEGCCVSVACNILALGMLSAASCTFVCILYLDTSLSEMILSRSFC